MEESDDDFAAFEKDTVGNEEPFDELFQSTTEEQIARARRQSESEEQDAAIALELQQSIEQQEREEGATARIRHQLRGSGTITEKDQAIASELQARWASDAKRVSEITAIARQMLESGANNEWEQATDKTQQQPTSDKRTTKEDKKRNFPIASEDGDGDEDDGSFKAPRLARLDSLSHTRPTLTTVKPIKQTREEVTESSSIRQPTNNESPNEQSTRECRSTQHCSESNRDNQDDGRGRLTQISGQSKRTQAISDRIETPGYTSNSFNEYLQVPERGKILHWTAFIDPDPDELAVDSDFIYLNPPTPPKPKNWRTLKDTRGRLNTDVKRIYTEFILPDRFIDNINTMLDFIYNWPEEDAKEIMRSFKKDSENKGRRVKFKNFFDGARIWTVRLEDRDPAVFHPRVYPTSHKLPKDKRPFRFDRGVVGKLPDSCSLDGCSPGCPKRRTKESERKSLQRGRQIKRSELALQSMGLIVPTSMNKSGERGGKRDMLPPQIPPLRFSTGRIVGSGRPFSELTSPPLRPLGLTSTPMSRSPSPGNFSSPPSSPRLIPRNLNGPPMSPLGQSLPSIPPAQQPRRRTSESLPPDSTPIPREQYFSPRLPRMHQSKTSQPTHQENTPPPFQSLAKLPDRRRLKKAHAKRELWSRNPSQH